MKMKQTNQRIVRLASELVPLRSVDRRLVSYNIEMAEITGGTFWKAYTPGQIAGTEAFPPVTGLRNITAMSELMQYYPPVNLYHPRLRALAKELGPAWIRVSGTWATKTYYDFEGTTHGKAPAGYQSVLTKEQWIGVLEFVKAVGGRLLISVSNCEGDHPDHGPLDLTQAEKIFAFSHRYGVDIDAVEFMNEPNMMEMSGAPAGYTPQDYARDQDILYSWVRKNYPDCLLVGPCTTGDPSIGSPEDKSMGAGIGSIAPVCTTEELMKGTSVKLDVFSYHYYNGISERLASMMPQAHWNAQTAHTDAYLAVAPACAKNHTCLRDRFVRGGQMWVTESGDAGGGGNTWASTYLDVFRTLNELGSFAAITDGVIFHNTLASSDYGFLQPETFVPRPNYFAVLLWEAMILGTLCMVGMAILRIPYAPMIGALVGVTALIPLVGAFIGTIVGAIMILTVNPFKAFVFVVFLLVLQQIEGNMIYPKVVGSKINLPAIWVLAAVTIGGNLGGPIGMLLGVPAASAAYALLKEATAKREKAKP